MSNTPPPPPPSPKEYFNPHRWITPEVFMNYARVKNINLGCKECNFPGPHWIDTGAGDGMVPRSTAYSMTAQGHVNMQDSVHMPVTRVVCGNCGNVRLFAMYMIEIWRSTYQPTGDLFGGQNNGNP